LGKSRQLVEVIVAELLAESRIQRIAAGEAVAVAVVGVQEIIGHAVGIRVEPALFDHPTETIQAGILIAAVGVAAGDDIGLVDAGLRMGTGYDSVEAEIAVSLQGCGAVGDGREAADPVIDAGIVVVVQNAAVGISHAHQPAMVRAAARGHEAVGVLHAGRRGGIHGPGNRLVFRDQLPQAIVDLLHLADNRGAGGIRIAGVQVRPAYEKSSCVLFFSFLSSGDHTTRDADS
jgi:hypothetical protein